MIPKCLGQSVKLQTGEAGALLSFWKQIVSWNVFETRLWITMSKVSMGWGPGAAHPPHAALVNQRVEAAWGTVDGTETAEPMIPGTNYLP